MTTFARWVTSIFPRLPLFPPLTTHQHTACTLYIQPSRLPVPVGRHPGHCLLVTAPSARHNTPHHTTPHHTTPHHTTPHHTTPHHTTPHHTTPHRPTAPREGGSERRENHSPLPSGNAAVRSTISTAHSPQAAWQCVTLPTAPCPQQQCSRAHTVQCGAEHQAVRHHTEGTGGAARHAGCSGQMRPCVTARRRRQGSVGQVRECTGPAMPQHTYTQRAHNTHSPARLPVPVGRHPGLCLLVTAPSAHHTTPHHTTPHHTTPHHTTPHHTTQHTTHDTQHHTTTTH